ncbi:hypothetical protein G9A89_019201 [Geosiphon pyriformis]|nr:hypothetical protein G9A89_019201 [Geosiphon pyriformis]
MSNFNEESNQSWVLSKGQLELENRSRPKPKPYEVLIAVKATGICGSDVHYWVDGKIGSFIVNSPLVLGHESAGVVTDIGDNVSGLQIGDQVAIEPGVPCYKCDLCKRGEYNLCLDMKFAATPPIDGTLCQYYCAPADFCVKLPPNFPLGVEGGALIEPLSVGIHACARAELKSGQSVIIFGAGPIGLLCGAVAKASGAIKVTIIDISQGRLDFAQKYVASEVILAEIPQLGENPLEYSKKFYEKLRGIGIERADVILECSGAETSIQTGLYMTRSGGTFVQVGMGKDVVSVPITDVGVREVNIRGTFRYRNTYSKAVKMVAAGLIDLKPLITHRYKFKEAVKAFETVRYGKEGVIKALILAE